MCFAHSWVEDFMIKGIYRAASGMLPRIKRQEVIANNLANVNTAGFKRQGVFSEELGRAEQRIVPKQEGWETPMLSDIYTDFSQAVLDPTGNDLDIALDGSGFLVVESPDGQECYTRAGGFSLSTEGQLITPSGYSLVSDSGPITIDADSDFKIGIDGSISVNGEEVGKLALVDFEKPYNLERLDGSMFAAPDGVNPIEPEKLFVRQGYVERANVDVIKEMIDMISSFREFESNQKAIQIADETLQKTVNQVGAKR